MKNKLALYISLLVIAVLTFYISTILQQTISYNDGLGWDGVKYHKIAQDFQNSEIPTTLSPFVSRLGLPFLASQFDDIFFGFTTINLLFYFLNLMLLIYLLEQYSNKNILIFFISLIYILQWHSGFRFLVFYPIMVDSAAIFFILISFLIILRVKSKIKKAISLTILVFIGAFFREIVIIPAIIFFFSQVKFNSIRSIYKSIPKQLIYYLPFLFFIISQVLIFLYINPTNNHKFYNVAIGNFYTKSFVNWLHAWLVAFGPILFILFLNHKNSLEFLSKHKEVSIYLIVILIFSFIGGSDTERIAFWSFPVVLLLIVNSIENMKLNKWRKLAMLLIIIGQIIAMRLFMVIPDYDGSIISSSKFILFTPLFDDNYLNLFASYSDIKSSIISFSQYLFFYVLVYFIYNKKP